MDKISNERKAQIFYQGDGTQTQYAFPFDYLRKAFVHVALISNERVEELTQGTDYTITDRVVTLAAPTGLKIKIYRQTTTKPLVGWADASVLRAADMTVQSTQLLHLAEETSDLAQDGGLSKDTTDNIWDARYNKIKNLLDPTEPGDAVTLNYITKKQTGLLTQLNTTGDTQNKRLLATGDAQNTRLVTTGNSYVSTMTTLKDTATIKANDASTSAELSKRWAMYSSSPDGVSGNKSSKTWAEEAKTSASNSAASASSSQSSASASSYSASNASNSANASKQSATASANSASAAASSASNAKISETNADNSAKAAKQSEENAKTWDPTQYVKSVTEANGKLTVTKGGGDSTIINLIDTFYPIGTVYMSADKTKTKSDFPFMAYGTWEEVPANLCLQTGAASEAGTQRSAGLPNITGVMGTMACNATHRAGACVSCPTQSYIADPLKWENLRVDLGIDASKSNPIYGSSDTVQPPAYMVRAWVRTA